MMSSFNSTSVFNRDFISPAPFRRRWGWLAASLALNLVLVGFICAWSLGMRSHTPNSWQREIVSSLSAGDAAVVEHGIKGIADARAPGDLLIQAQHDQFHATLKTDPTNKILLKQLMDDIAKSRFNQALAINQAFLDELSELSPDGRSQIEAEMQRIWPHSHQPPR
jgi:hypothetical protein